MWFDQGIRHSEAKIESWPFEPRKRVIYPPTQFWQILVRNIRIIARQAKFARSCKIIIKFWKVKDNQHRQSTFENLVWTQINNWIDGIGKFATEIPNLRLIGPNLVF